MTPSLVHGIAAGLMLALGWGDSPPDTCSLLLEDEAEAILSTRLGPPQPQAGGDCWYLSEGGAGIADAQLILSVLPVQLKSEAEFDAFVTDQVKGINEKMQESGLEGYKVEKVADLGAPAYYADLGLYVFKAGRVLLIGTGRPKAVAIAAKALPRFK